MSDRRNERRGLGRGLSALMADVGIASEVGSKNHQANVQASSMGRPVSAPIDRLHPNPQQPRRSFDEAMLSELAESIKAKGIVQPIVVRNSPTTENHYEIVAGERRWRAAQLAQLDSVPIVVRDFDDLEMLEVAIIENIQREGLNAIEEAAGYRQLIDRFGHTQEKVAAALGKSRSHIANLLRLLNLPQDVQNMIVSGTLSAGHARALITATDPSALARQVVEKGLSVRETEALARKASTPKTSASRDDSRRKDADTRVLEEDLSANLGMGVVIDHRAGGEGKLTIHYKSLDQLDQLCQILSGPR
ncbi:MAG: ParB/RepB/Spo0J family partition protein [Pararhodobacter sp.]